MQLSSRHRQTPKYTNAAEKSLFNRILSIRYHTDPFYILTFDQIS